ncbi:unnamed protein product, partial [marine sediment metagenome]
MVIKTVVISGITRYHWTTKGPHTVEKWIRNRL